ncbi:hypothetical protein APB26_31895 [Pseudomonas aeruginosa]|uniref:cysteine peptidase family C39 domain-containing protein n=1 Tax=Pseudomonas aeruginosa TaxID=287 RepID=UPI0008FB5E8C|nr:hypothetical protein APB26_31895 [Pseudomonas aeruginosa]RPV61261.1 hypothetical protein IPC838_18225 [Pseudomonas aeruginosa]
MTPSNARTQPTRPLTTVLQEDSHGCGVACLAMIAGVDYLSARDTFTRLGYGVQRKNKQPFSSNFTDLMSALQQHGILTKMARWVSWEALNGLGILKVANGHHNSWHWVVARPAPDSGVVIHDPLRSSISLIHAPAGSGSALNDDLVPYGNWIRIL